MHPRSGAKAGAAAAAADRSRAALICIQEEGEEDSKRSKSRPWQIILTRGAAWRPRCCRHWVSGISSAGHLSFQPRLLYKPLVGAFDSVIIFSPFILLNGNVFDGVAGIRGGRGGEGGLGSFSKLIRLAMKCPVISRKGQMRAIFFFFNPWSGCESSPEKRHGNAVRSV